MNWPVQVRRSSDRAITCLAIVEPRTFPEKVRCAYLQFVNQWLPFLVPGFWSTGYGPKRHPAIEPFLSPAEADCFHALLRGALHVPRVKGKRPAVGCR